LTDKVKKVYTLIIKRNEANKMTLTIEIETATDWAVIEVPATIDCGLTVVAGTEIHDDFILALDGVEYPMSEVDEANWASAQYLYDNASRKAAVYGDHYTDWL
jgi:hypothetical protein